MRTTFVLLGFLYIWIAVKLSFNEAIVFKFTNLICVSYNQSWFVWHKWGEIPLDVCRLVKRAYNPFAKLVFNLFKEFSNFNHSCPYMGSQIVDGFYLRSNYLPHTLPTGDYLLSITWLFDKTPQFLTKVYFIFTEDL